MKKFLLLGLSVLFLLMSTLSFGEIDYSGDNPNDFENWEEKYQNQFLKNQNNFLKGLPIEFELVDKSKDSQPEFINYWTLEARKEWGLKTIELKNEEISIQKNERIIEEKQDQIDKENNRNGLTDYTEKQAKNDTKQFFEAGSNLREIGIIGKYGIESEGGIEFSIGIESRKLGIELNKRLGGDDKFSLSVGGKVLNPLKEDVTVAPLIQVDFMVNSKFEGSLEVAQEFEFTEEKKDDYFKGMSYGVFSIKYLF